MAMTKEQLKHVLYAARAHMKLAEMHFGEPKDPAQKAAVDLALVVSAAFEAGAHAARNGFYFQGTTHLDVLVGGASEYMAQPASTEPVTVMGSPVFYGCRAPCCAHRPRAFA